MGKKNRSKFFKIARVIIPIILIGLCFAYLHISKVAAGSEEGSLPVGYKLVDANGLSFSVKVTGNENDIPVILLHGFPVSSEMWKRLMLDLNGQGYYTIAPDQRGYSYKARPEEISEYKISYLADDVIAIADALGVDKFHMIGHDWGSGVGWQVAAETPERLLSYTALSVPHLDAFSRLIVRILCSMRRVIILENSRLSYYQNTWLHVMTINYLGLFGRIMTKKLSNLFSMYSARKMH